MILLLASWALLQAPSGEDEAILRRLNDLVEKLGSDDIDVRERAGEGLLGLPSRFSARLEEIARKSAEPEVAARLRAFVIPFPWARALGGTLREARLLAATLEGLESAERRRAVAAAMEGLAARPAADASASLSALLELPSPGARDFALEAMSRFPPRELGPIARMLEDPPSAERAAAILIRARDPATHPQVLEAFLRGSLPAGKVLERSGAGGDVGRLVAAARKTPDLRPLALKIIERSDPAQAEESLIGWLKVEDRDSGAAEELLGKLAAIGGSKSVAAIRDWYRGVNPRDGTGESLLAQLRDPELGGKWLQAARAKPSDVEPERILQIAAMRGPAARDGALAWLAEPGLKIGVQKKAVLLLGAVGRPGDAGLLVSKLKDPRLLESAVEALDMLGNPAAAGELAEALKRAPHFTEGGQILMGLPAESLSATIEEILADPRGYSHLLDAAFQLAERSPSPRMRESLFEGLSGRGPLDSHRAGAIRVLARTAADSDVHAIRPLRAHAETETRATGLVLAAGRGDREAAAELAGLIADQRIPFQSLNSRLPLDVIPADLWKSVLVEEWHKKPDWPWGALALAEMGIPEALGEVRRWKDSYAPMGLQGRARLALLLGGDSDELEPLVKQHFAGLKRDEVEALVARAGDGLKKRLFLRAQADSNSRLACLPIVAGMAIPEAVPLYLEELAAERRNPRIDLHLSIRALRILNRRDAIPDIRPQLRSTEPATVASACAALAALGDRTSIDWIVRLLDDPSEVVERRTIARPDDRRLEPKRRVWHAAMEALEKMTGVATAGASVAERREFWRTWYEKNGR